MEAIAAFSLACNVIQVVDFGLKVADMCHKTYKTGQVKPELKDVSKEFRAAYEVLQQSVPLNSRISTEDQAILDLGRKCDDSANKLLARLSKMEGSKGQKIGALRRTVKVLWETSKIEEMQKQFESYQKMLETRILIDLRRRHNLVAIKQSEGFDHLSEAIQRLVIKLESGETRLDAIITDQHNRTRELVISEIGKLRLELKSDVHHKEVLKSLHFSEMISRQENVSDAYSNTFDWILDPPQNPPPDGGHSVSDEASIPSHPSLLEWLKTGDGIYWVCGKAGSGKSTLMRYICEDERAMSALRLSSKSPEVLIIKYFFWFPGSKLQKSIVGLLRAILFQLVKAYPSLAQLCVTESGVGIQAWTEKRLVHVLFTMLQQESTPMNLCIFVDGLDELDGDLDVLLALLCGISQIPNVKLLVSSRPWRIFYTVFSNCPQIHLQELTERDIKIFVDGKLEEMQALIAIWEIAKLATNISRKADGVFLWVSLATASVIDGIRNGDNYFELSARLEELPKELNDLYSTLLSRIGARYRTQAMRYFQLLLLDPVSSELELSVLVLSLVDLKLPRLSEYSGHDTASDIGNQEAALRQCNQTMVHLLQRCGGLLHLQFEGGNANQIPGKDFAKDKSRIPTQVNSLAEADALHVQFLHRTVFDWLRDLIRSDDLPKFQSNDSGTLWNPAVARAEALVRKIPVMCKYSQILHSSRRAPVEYLGVFKPEISQLAAAVVAVREAERFALLPQEELLLEIDFQGGQLMNLITECCDLNANTPWCKLLVPHDTPSTSNFRHPMFSTLLELYSFAGFENFVMTKISNFPREDCARECTSLLLSALNSLTFLPVSSRNLSLIKNPLSFDSQAHMVMALLNAGADPNSRIEEIEESLIQFRGMVQPRSTIDKNPRCLTVWSFFLIMLTKEFYSNYYGSDAQPGQWHNRDSLLLWGDIIMSFIEKGADVEVVIPNLAIAIVGAKTVPNYTFSFELEFTFIFEGGVLPILAAYFFDHEDGRGVIQKLQSLNASSNVRFKCIQLNICTPWDNSKRTMTTEALARLLSLPKDAAVFQEAFELEAPHQRGRIFSWDVPNLIDHLAPQVMEINRPIWAKNEEQYSSLWDYDGGNTMISDESFEKPNGTPSHVPEVLEEVMRILNDVAESGNLELCHEFCYRNMDWITPKE